MAMIQAVLSQLSRAVSPLPLSSTESLDCPMASTSRLSQARRSLLSTVRESSVPGGGGGGGGGASPTPSSRSCSPAFYVSCTSSPVMRGGPGATCLIATSSSAGELNFLRPSPVPPPPLPKPLSGRRKRRMVQASDGHFFERLAAPFESATENSALESKNSSSQEQRDAEVAALRALTLGRDAKSHEALYVEALYTIVHKIGKDDGAGAHLKPDLIRYAQQAFEVEPAAHTRLVEAAKEAKPPVVILNVLLLEARGLVAKDVNGFSDPFAMMGIVPGKVAATLGSPIAAFLNGGVVVGGAAGGAAALSPADDDKEGMLHRFSGSFRRKSKASQHSNGSTSRSSKENSIPAKLIKASSVQYKTLNPKWDEKFAFQLDEANSDKFHIDIWDHDDQDTSVIEAVSSLNQIKGGLKGIGRYFKEVAQSARDEGGTDDFLGCVTISIKDVPPEGLEEWFPLQKRSDKSKVSGSVRLKLWLSTKEDVVPGTDELLDVRQHVELIKQFALHEIKQSGAPARLYDGSLPDRAKIILQQHAIQGDITDIGTAMCKWLAFHGLLGLDVSFALLAEALENFVQIWKPLALDKEEEDAVVESLQHFAQHCRHLLLEHRSKFRPGKRAAAEEFACMLKCFRIVKESAIYQKNQPSRRTFASSVESLLVQSAEKHFDRVLRQARPEEPLEELLQLLVQLNHACANFPHFAPALRDECRLDYSQLTLSVFSRLLSEYQCAEMMSERSADLKERIARAASQDPENEDSLVMLIRIHLAAVEFRNYRLANRVRVDDELMYASYFDQAIGRLLQAIRERATARVVLSCRLDTPITTGANEMKQSSSHIDVCHIVEQLAIFWERALVTSTALRVDFTAELVDIICDVALDYCQRVLAQLDSDGFGEQLQVFVPKTLVAMMCSAINNCEQVRRVIAIHDRLHLDELASKFEKEGLGRAVPWREELDNKLESASQRISAMIDATVDTLIQRLLALMRKHVFHLAWSPGATPIEQAIKPLTDMLDVELSVVHRILLHRNFIRVLSAQVAALVKLLAECVDENKGQEAQWYKRLLDAWLVLKDFFHAGGKGIPLDVLEAAPETKALVRNLRLNATESVELIEQYYADMIKQQDGVRECKYGILNVRAYYNAASQNLVVDVMGAKQLIPLDSNGLSDPFVVIELVPRHRFASAQLVKTRVVSKTLNPIFDEQFEFHVAPRLPACALLHFTVMDHDYLRSNDFAGEAFLELSDVPGFLNESGTSTVGSGPMASTLRQFNLVLLHPESNCKDLLAVLNERKDDKEATDFVRAINTSH